MKPQTPPRPLPPVAINLELTLHESRDLECALLAGIESVAEFKGEGGRDEMRTLANLHIENLVAQHTFHAERERRERTERHEKEIAEAVAKERAEWSPI